MRIISQDGRISMPAEYTVVYVDDCAVVAVTVDSPFGRTLATYSSESLAMKAINRMNSNLSAGNTFRFPTEKQLCAG